MSEREISPLYYRVQLSAASFLQNLLERGLNLLPSRLQAEIPGVHEWARDLLSSLPIEYNCMQFLIYSTIIDSTGAWTRYIRVYRQRYQEFMSEQEISSSSFIERVQQIVYIFFCIVSLLTWARVEPATIASKRVTRSWVSKRSLLFVTTI